jgi:nitrogen fixation-related uncharacterized protein
VTERDRGGRGTLRETTRDGSRHLEAFRGAIQGASPLAIGVTVAGVVAAVLLVVTEFSTIASVDVADGSCEVINDASPENADRCELSGFERHGGSFILLGLLAGAMAWGAGLGGSRPAALALVAVGVLVLAWALAFDLPEADEEGILRTYEGARGSAGPGLTLEIAGGVLAALAGLVRLLAPARE